jgi:hypothetical protein
MISNRSKIEIFNLTVDNNRRLPPLPLKEKEIIYENLDNLRVFSLSSFHSWSKAYYCHIGEKLKKPIPKSMDMKPLNFDFIYLFQKLKQKCKNK